MSKACTCRRSIPAAATYTVSIIRDIAQRYPIDGMHFDYIRYPGEDFDYGRETMAEYERAVASRDRTPERWRTFRAVRRHHAADQASGGSKNRQTRRDRQRRGDS